MSTATSRRVPIAVLSTLVACLLGAMLVYAAQGRAGGRQDTTWGAVGDSLTHGVGSSDLTTKSYPAQAGVVGHGVPGQCLVALGCSSQPLVESFPSELDYLQRYDDVTSVVVEIGINDLGHVTDRQYVEAYARLKSEGAAQGVRVVLSTMTPFASTYRVSSAVERQRERINSWIRHQGAYVDYDAALRAGVNMRPRFDSGDGLHPDDAGHAQMARALDRWIAHDG
jgi:lysophospholipase L1-like esterase